MNERLWKRKQNLIKPWWSRDQYWRENLALRAETGLVVTEGLPVDADAGGAVMVVKDGVRDIGKDVHRRRRKTAVGVVVADVLRRLSCRCCWCWWCNCCCIWWAGWWDGTGAAAAAVEAAAAGQIGRQRLDEAAADRLQRRLAGQRQHAQPRPHFAQNSLDVTAAAAAKEVGVDGVGPGRRENGGRGQRAGQHGQEAGVSGRQRDDGLSLAAQAVSVDGGGGGGQAKPRQDVVEEVERRDGGQVPPQLVKDQQLPVLRQQKH